MLRKLDKQRLKLAAIGVLFFYFIANAYDCLNYYPIWDNVNHVFSYDELNEASLGRYGSLVHHLIVGDAFNPWFISVVSVICLIFTTYLVTEMLEFKKPWSIILTGGFFSANLSVTAVKVLHVFFEDARMLSLLFGMVGIWFIYKQFRYSLLFSSLCFFASISLYQAFSSAILVMLLLLMFKELYRNGVSVISRNTVMRALAYVGAIVAGVIIYFLVFQLIQLCGIEAYTGRGNTIDSAFSGDFYTLLDQTYDNISELIRLFFVPYSKHRGGFYMINLMQIGGCILLTASIVVAILQTRKMNKKLIFISMLIVLIALIMTVSLSVNIFSWVKMLVFRLIYAIFFIYPLMIGITIEWRQPSSQKEKTIITRMIVVGAGCVLFWNIKISNSVYIVKQFSYERAQIAVSKVMDDIEDIYDYDQRTPVVLIGELALNDSYEDIVSEYEEYFYGLSNTSIGYQSLFMSMADLLGPQLTYETDPDVVAAYNGKEEVQKMPQYPQKGYLQEIDGRIVVKLGESYR